MPELMPLERLQPALLDRLTDLEPDARQEAREQRVMSKARLRQAVLRDLARLVRAPQRARGRRGLLAALRGRHVLAGNPVDRLCAAVAPDLDRHAVGVLRALRQIGGR